MPLGESNLVVSNAGMQVLYRGTQNTLGSIASNGLTKDNRSGAQALANTTLNDGTSKGILGGSVVRVQSTGQVGSADDTNTGVQSGIVGIALNDATGYAYESMSGAASEKVPYIHGTNTVVAVDVYETADTSGSALDYSAANGANVYASANGLLTIEEGLSGGTAGAGATVVGVILQAPTSTEPLMVVQLRV